MCLVSAAGDRWYYCPLLYGDLFYAIRVGKRRVKKFFFMGVALYVVYSLAYYEDTIQLLHNGGSPAINYAVTCTSRVVAFVLLMKLPLPEQRVGRGSANILNAHSTVLLVPDPPSGRKIGSRSRLGSVN